MATGTPINFIHFAKKNDFTSGLQTTYTNDIVFIKDTRELFTHGTFYKCVDNDTFEYLSSITVDGASTTLKGTNEGGTIILKAVNDGITLTCADGKINIGHKTNTVTTNTSTAKPNFGETITVPSVTYDTYGHLTAVTNTTVTLPTPEPNTDTKVTSAANHYDVTSSTLNGGTSSKNAPDATSLTFGTSAVITGVTVDSKGHITAVTGGKLPTPAQQTDYTATTVVGTSATATTNAAAANPFVNTVQNNAVKGSFQISGTANQISVNSNDSKNITVSIPASATLPGTPTVQTAPADSANGNEIVTASWVNNALGDKIAAADAMRFKGTVESNADLPASHKVGDTYKVAAAGTYAGEVCEIGDMIICVATGTTAKNTDWAVIQTNIDGAVTSSSTTSGAANIAVFDGTTGKIIKDGGKTIASLENVVVDGDRGLSLVSQKIGHANTAITARTADTQADLNATNGGSFKIQQLQYDAYGHITAGKDVTITLPTINDTHYTSKNIIGGTANASANGTATNTTGVFLNHIENNEVTSSHKIVGSGSVTVEADTNGNLTIKGATYTDNVTSALVIGASATSTANDATNAVYLNLVEGGTVSAANSHLIEGTGIAKVTATSGKITINATETLTSVDGKSGNTSYVTVTNGAVTNQQQAITITPIIVNTKADIYNGSTGLVTAAAVKETMSWIEYD